MQGRGGLTAKCSADGLHGAGLAEGGLENTAAGLLHWRRHPTLRAILCEGDGRGVIGEGEARLLLCRLLLRLCLLIAVVVLLQGEGRNGTLAS